MNVTGSFAKIALLAFIIAIAFLTCITGLNYVGSAWIYLLFTILANGLLLNGFRRRALFFDTFIGLFFWLGFWLKFSIRVAFTSSVFHEPVGLFDGSAQAFDNALIISSCGFAAVLTASLVRERFFSYPAELPTLDRAGIFTFYEKHRIALVSGFILIVMFFAVSNGWLGIYQRGVVTQTHLPYGLNGVYKWLLQFGLASFCALIIRLEIEIHRRLTTVSIAAPLLETFLSNTSLLSRGMILNFSAIALGAHRMLKGLRVRPKPVVIASVFAIFAVAFTVSVLSVNYLRALKQEDMSTYGEGSKMVGSMTAPLFVDRWVGIEGVMAVSSYNRLGWDLWHDAWQERFQEGTMSLYDRQFINSPYTNPAIDWSKNHYVSLPGIVAFLFYPGSFSFLFVAMFSCAVVAAIIEISAYYLCGNNVILCSLFGQVVAFRLASFGYVPIQSYLLFGSLVLNIFTIYCLQHLMYWRERKDGV